MELRLCVSPPRTSHGGWRAAPKVSAEARSNLAGLVQRRREVGCIEVGRLVGTIAVVINLHYVPALSNRPACCCRPLA